MLVMPFVRKSYVTYIVQCNFFPAVNIYLEAVQWASCCGFAVFCHQIPRLCKVSDTQKIMSKEHNSQPYTFLHWDVKSNHYKPANQFLLQPYSIFLLLSPSTLKQFQRIASTSKIPHSPKTFLGVTGVKYEMIEILSTSLQS